VEIDTSGTPIIMNHGAAVRLADQAEQKEPKTTKSSKSVKAAAASPAKRKRKPGRPKAGRLDVPLAITTAIAEPTPEPTPAPSTIAEPVTVAASVAETAVKPEPTITPQPTIPVKPKLPMAPQAKGRRLSDIAPVRRPMPAKATEQPANDDTPQLKSADERAATVSNDLPLGLHDHVTLSAFSWSAVAATFLALLVGGATFVLVGNHAGRAIQRTQQAGWPVWGEIVLVLALYYVSRSLASGATTYAAARRADHRQAPPRHQWHAAINSFWARVRFDMIVVTLQGGIVALAAALLMMGGSAWPVPGYVQLVALFMAYLALMYVFIGLSFVQGLGRAGLTLSTISAHRALTVGWQFFSHHFELAGFRVVSLLVELALLAPLVGAVVLLAVYLPAGLEWLVPAAATLLTILGGGLIGAGMATWWHGIYRRLVIGHRLGEAVTLLSSRRVEKLQRGTYWSTIAITLILAGLAIAWPWLPTQF
jgi:hypothetical protein